MTNTYILDAISGGEWCFELRGDTPEEKAKNIYIHLIKDGAALPTPHDVPKEVCDVIMTHLQALLNHETIPNEGDTNEQ